MRTTSTTSTITTSSDELASLFFSPATGSGAASVGVATQVCSSEASPQSGKLSQYLDFEMHCPVAAKFAHWNSALMSHGVKVCGATVGFSGQDPSSEPSTQSGLLSQYCDFGMHCPDAAKFAHWYSVLMSHAAAFVASVAARVVTASADVAGASVGAQMPPGRHRGSWEPGEHRLCTILMHSLLMHIPRLHPEKHDTMLLAFAHDSTTVVLGGATGAVVARTVMGGVATVVVGFVHTAPNPQTPSKSDVEHAVPIFFAMPSRQDSAKHFPTLHGFGASQRSRSGALTHVFLSSHLGA